MPPPASVHPLANPRLFKEHAICDLTMYKTGNIGLRWCTEKDVLSGKGKETCGNKHCAESGPLQSYEV